MEEQTANGSFVKDAGEKESLVSISELQNGIDSKSDSSLKRQRTDATENEEVEPHHKKSRPTRRVRVGSRRSQLALFQTNFVVDLLRKKNPSIQYEIVPMTTTGDQILNKPLSKIGEKSLFTKELEVALQNGDVDMIVHSLKDLPTSLPSGMVIGAICKRENPYDAVVFRPDHSKSTLRSLPNGSVVGTSSLRRVAQLRRAYPHLQFQSVRGNLNTRLRKLDEDGTYVALILAAAGLIRMDLVDRISAELSPEECLYAVGQGALAIECKADDQDTLRLLSSIADQETTVRCIAERSFMKTLEGGCSAPVAVCSSMDNDKLTLKGGVFSLDGSESIIDNATYSIDISTKESEENNNESFCGVAAPYFCQCILQQSEQLGINLANCLLHKGAKAILTEARAQNESLR